MPKLFRTISMLALAVTFVSMAGTASNAKGGPVDPTRLFVRTNEQGVTMRVYSGSIAEYGIDPRACSGPGCPPPACVPRGELVIGFSTEAAVGQGWAQFYKRGNASVQVIGIGGVGFEFDAPVAYVVAQTGASVDRVRVKFQDGSSDEMQPRHHLVVLSAPLRDSTASMFEYAGPTGSIEAFDRDGRRVARQRFSTNPYPNGQPKRCVGGLERGFPAPKADPPADEAAARYGVIAAFNSAYGHEGDIEDRAAFVEDGSALLPVTNVAAERNPQFRDALAPEIAEVRFIDATRAAVRFSLVADGMPIVSGIGRAVLVDDQWLVARRTYCDLLKLGGVWCPTQGNGG